jgi:hypothetical protein
VTEIYLLRVTIVNHQPQYQILSNTTCFIRRTNCAYYLRTLNHCLKEVTVTSRKALYTAIAGQDHHQRGCFNHERRYFGFGSNGEVAPALQ